MPAPRTGSWSLHAASRSKPPKIPRHAGQALNNLAALNGRMGRSAEAERLYKQAVAAYEKTFGPDHPDLADVLQSMADLYKDQGRHADAREILRRSMAIRAKAGSPG